jgi:hypothetical protein
LQLACTERTGLEVTVDELKHPRICDALLHPRHQLVVIDPIEELLQIHVHHQL